VLALRDAANRVGEGDLTQSVTNRSKDEIGELSIAFNKMVKDLGIEASLERVRAKAMAMRYSKDLEITIASLFYELDHIGFASEYSGVGIINSKNKRAEFWTTNSPNGERESLGSGNISLEDHPFLRGMYAAWEHQSYYVYMLIGDDYHNYYQQFGNSGVTLPADALKESAAQSMQYCYSVMFKAGALTIFRSQPLDDGNMKILQRFADVFHLAYTRSQDLHKTEVSAIEELKQASLDRVRGEFASMRTKEDLERITHVVWRELTTLGVNFIRCGVFIVNEVQQTIHSYLSSPSGTSLGIYNLAFDANDIAKKLIEYWRKGIAYKEHWNKEQFVEFISSLVKHGQIENQNSYLGSSPPPDTLELHFFPFPQGLLYVGNTTPLVHEEMELSQSLTKAFSIAYARYEDFIHLEEANTKMEKTLDELKSTQSQLIHSEKMASLGELTAGIAHEIQNPLNFVNNFSEVNKELIDELKEEIAAGNIDEVKAIADDIESNEEKINFHGKRADTIVKGMLQHSRSSTGTKEPTDINVLADEYLRLAYHGLRAKDKSFNAIMKTDFDFQLSMDEGGEPIKIIPQDMGRVILNLITNAFYVVNERKNAGEDPAYEPTVSVYTKKTSSAIEIGVSDNGNGIPKNIIDKIFQPFFTTKPTGKGTGLGLSMSYDIVKHGHGGELKVETKDGVGTSFLIILPL
jgi:signal transduction histidine kinase